jgi:general secretion pathway protein F
VAVAVLLLGVLVPRAQAALAAGGIALPSASLAVVRVARGVAWGAAGLLLALTAGAAALSRLCRVDDAWQVRADRLRLTLPGAGRIAARLAAARFASTLAVLAGAGVPLVEALPLAGAATGNRWLERRVAQETERVRHGLALEAAIRAIPPLAGPLAEWIRVGEAGGCLDRMLEAAARREQAEWERAMTRLLALFEPAVLVAVGLFVLAVALAVLLPVTALTRGFV